MNWKVFIKCSQYSALFEPTVLTLTHSPRKEQMDHRIRNLIFFVDKSQNTTHRFQKVRESLHSSSQFPVFRPPEY